MRRACRVCGGMTLGMEYRYCARHGATENGRRGQLAVDHGLRSARWRTLRSVVLIRDSFCCQLRHPGCTEVATTVHLDPSLGGDHRGAQPIDCISACSHCHGVEDAPRSSGQRERQGRG